jgi:glycosyltransferase involved in cell wall biosynthesis
MSHSSSISSLYIVFVTPEYVTETHFDGGLANYIYRISRALIHTGHQVHVVTLSDIDQSTFDHDGVLVHRLMIGKLSHWMNYLTQNRIQLTCKWLDFSIQVYQTLRRIHQVSPLDIVQFPNWSCCGLISSLFLPVPHVLRISSYRPLWNQMGGNKPDLDSRLIEWLEVLQLRLSSYIYAPSFTLQRILARDANIHNVRVIRTPFYLETKDWDFSIVDRLLPSKKYLLFFGRFQVHKGFHILSQSLPEVFQACPDCNVVCVGQDMGSSVAPSMKNYMRSQCHDFLDRLTFIPQLPHSQLYPVLSQARLVVLPSLIDNMPNACLEAMALSKPVVGTIGASFEELIVDQETGFLVAPNDVAALEKTLISAWHHPDLDRIGNAARKRIADFSPESIVEVLVSFYREISNSSGRSTSSSTTQLGIDPPQPP